MSALNDDLKKAQAGLADQEQRLARSTAEQQQLQKKLQEQQAQNERKKQEMQAQARKAVEEVQAKVAERRQWAQQQQQLQEVGIRDLRNCITQADTDLKTALSKFLVEEKQANRGVQPSAHEAHNITESVDGLTNLLDHLLPSGPSEIQMRRLEQARQRVLAALAHETVTLRKQALLAGIPPPTNPSTQDPGSVPHDVAQPVVKVHLSFEGAAGLASDASRKGRSYSIAAMRNGKVHETPRRLAQGGVVEWGCALSFLTRLAPAGHKAIDILPCVIAEYMADGSLSESLPFDVDLAPLACQPPKQVVLLPLASNTATGARLRVSCHVHTSKVRPKVLAPPGVNPLRPLGDLWGESKHFRSVTAECESSGDEGAPPAAHTDPSRM